MDDQDKVRQDLTKQSAHEDGKDTGRVTPGAITDIGGTPDKTVTPGALTDGGDVVGGDTDRNAL